MRLKKAGYELKDGTMIGPDGKPLTFEILLNGKSGEAVAAAWQRTLEKLGIAVTHPLRRQRAISAAPAGL